MLYWVSAIIQGEKPSLLAMSQGELSLDKAMEIVNNIKANNTVLSIWIDIYHNDSNKQTVFHECYINAFGDIEV